VKKYVILLTFLCHTEQLIAQSPEAIRAAANKFLTTLDSSEIKKARFEFNDPARLKWTNLPVGMVPRPGIRYGSLKDSSKTAFHQLLTTVLSSRGYLKITSIMRLDDILNILIEDAHKEGKMGKERLTTLQNLQWSYDNYFISLWGHPDPEAPWAVNFGGHHIALSITVTGNSIATTPLFLGTDPAEVKSGRYSGVRVLSKEEDYGFQLLNLLSEAQKKKAILSREVPGDILTNPNSNQRITEYTGIPAGEMSKDQQEKLNLLIHEYVHNFEHDIAHKLIAKVNKTGIEKVYFAWIGSGQKDSPHYYMVNGPDFLIEYDNFQGNGNHLHLILREKGNDFGEDILRKHYLESDHHKKQ